MYAKHLRIIDWLVVAVSLIIIAFLAQGVHDMATTYLGVPRPDESGVPTWIRFFRLPLYILSITIACYAAKPFLDNQSFPVAASVVCLLLLALNEVFRVIVILWVLRDGWVWPNGAYILTQHFPRSVSIIFQGLVALTISRHVLKSQIVVIIAISFIAAVVNNFLITPQAIFLAGLMQEGLGFPEEIELYSKPYPFFVNAYIYGMFIEPTVATFILAMIASPRLGKTLGQRMLMFMVLILFIRGLILSSTIYLFWSKQPVLTAFVSEAQFLLEFAVLALLAGLVNEWASRRVRHRRALSD